MSVSDDKLLELIGERTMSFAEICGECVPPGRGTGKLAVQITRLHEQRKLRMTPLTGGGVTIAAFTVQEPRK